MLKRLKERLAEYNYKKELKNFKPSGFPDWSKKQRVLVLLNFKDLERIKLKKTGKVLGSLGNLEINYLSYYPNAKQLEKLEVPNAVQVLTDKELSFSLKPISKEVYTHDLYIDFTHQQEWPLQFVLLNAKAKSRLGIQQPWNKAFLDFMIQADADKSFTFVAEQIVHYLKLINTNAA